MKFIRCLLSVLIVVSIIFTLTVGKKEIGKNGLDLTQKPYKGIITVWHIDAFEGGVFSRSQFLLKIARMYEKNNDGVLIMVTNHTFISAEQSINEGVFPDAISYGVGLNLSGQTELTLKNKFIGGNVGDKSYALPWCKGGYVLFTNPELVNKNENEMDTLIVSQAQYTQPLTALSLEGITAKKVEVLQPLDAYVKFVSGKYPYFLGTQRDVHRLTSRGFNFEAKVLTEYNDLYQYVSITATDQLKSYYANDFINFLLKEESQKKLYEIGMFSHFFDVEYDIDILRELSKTRQKLTISAFNTPDKLKELQAVSLLSVKGDKDALNKIKNIAI